MNNKAVEPPRNSTGEPAGPRLTGDPGGQPIGYWLNRCDRAITNAMNSRLAPHGANRFDWQVLNVVAKNGTVSEAHLYEFLRANADRQTLAASIDTLLSQGHLRRTDTNPGELTLTERGNAFRQHLGEQMATFRQESLRGITEEEYQTTVSVLQRMTQNLETG